MSVGPFQILVIALLALVLFGRGRISALMGDVGKGVKTFRKELAEDEPSPAVSAASEVADPKAAADHTNG